MPRSHLTITLITAALLVVVNQAALEVLFALTGSVNAAKWGGMACGSAIVGLTVGWRFDRWARLRFRKTVVAVASLLYVAVDPFCLALFAGRYMWSMMDAAAIVWSFAPFVFVNVYLGTWIGAAILKRTQKRGREYRD